MEYVTLYNGVKMPMLGFGTWDVTGKDGEQVILDAVDAGYRLFDTAQMYRNHHVIGTAFMRCNAKRKDVFITSKLSRDMSYEEAKRSIDEIIDELQLTYLDLVLIHEPYRHIEDMYRALEEAYKQGKVKAIGISNYHLKPYAKLIKKLKTVPMVNQVECHVYNGRLALKREMEPYGTVMEAWAPLTEGRKDIFHEEVLMKIGDKYHKSAAQIALRYLIQRGIVVVVKSSHKERMEENINIFDFELNDEEMHEIHMLDKHESLFNWYSE